MVVDTSTIVSILLREEGHEQLEEKIAAAPTVFIGAPTVFEAAMVLSGRYGRDARPVLQEFLSRMRVQVIPFSETHASAATAAFLRYGRGFSPAKLNFGDCMAYAVATQAGMPLLFKGDDFGRTDVRAAL